MTDSSEGLVSFLRARLDEDERVAQRVQPNQSPVELRAMVTREGSAPFLVVASERVLREVEAKRRIIDEYERYAAERRRAMGGWNTDAISPILTALAAVYADHPDYREEWRP